MLKVIKDEGAQDEGAQDEGAQDEGAQDEGAQDGHLDFHYTAAVRYDDGTS